MAGNPFRRATSSRPEEEPRYRETTPPPSNARSIKKKVKIQTPPDSPEAPQRRVSAGRLSPPPPPQTADDGEDSDSTATADSELEEALRNTRRNSGSLPPPSSLPAASTKAPYNPFARTLTTTEAAYGLSQPNEDVAKQDEEAQTRPSAGRPALNVEEFKNILLTGSAAPSPPVPTSAQQLQENSSATDTSSVSRHSLFDPQYDIQTPRSSLDHMDGLESASSDDDEQSSLMSGADRLDDLAPPAPPKHIQGLSVVQKGPQTVSFADFDQSVPSAAALARMPTPPVSKVVGDTLKPPVLRRTPSDLNKPLPEPPLSSEIAFDSRNSWKPVPQLPAQTAIITEDGTQSKVTPPPPPTARRLRSSSSPKQADKDAPLAKPAEILAKPIAPPPPPPPSRKNRAVNQPAPINTEPFSTNISMEAPSPAPSTTETKTMPPPPPPRQQSKRPNAVVRSPSDTSQSSGQYQPQQPKDFVAAPLPQTAAPPAPPPRRSAGTSSRTSIDGRSNSTRTSIDGRPASLKDHRRNSGQSIVTVGVGGGGGDAERSASLPSLTQVTESSGEVAQQLPARPLAGSSRDILADMSAFQAEIDALRARAGNG